MPAAKNTRRSFDFDFKVLKRVRKIPFKYSPSSEKIKIKKIKKRPKRIWPIFAFVGLGIFIVIFANTKIARTLVIANSLFGKSNLIGFQNSAELRPTGGFWGSFATLDLKGTAFNPKLGMQIETNVYRKDNLLVNANLDNAPKPVAETFVGRPQTFVNANWEADFNEAAKTIGWYFGQGWQKPIDNVVAVSSISMIELLKLTGQISLSDGTNLSADNFTEIMSKNIEQDYWLKPENKVENEPKKILLEILPKIEDRLKTISKITLLKTVFRLLEQKNILIYSSDEAVENIVAKNRWSGEIPRSGGDFVYVINANLNGGKSSLNVDQKLALNVREENGNLVNHLTITRNHKTGKWPSITNRNYTRVLVPLGSNLISVKDKGGILQPSQIEMTEESGKKSIGFWLSTGYGEENSVELAYTLPPSINRKNYELTLVRQPGTNFDNFLIDFFDKTKSQTVFQDLNLSF